MNTPGRFFLPVRSTSRTMGAISSRRNTEQILCYVRGWSFDRRSSIGVHPGNRVLPPIHLR